MTTREIPPLSSLILKAISRWPAIHLTKESADRLRIFIDSHSQLCSDFDITQHIINAVTEAGRLTDDALPIEIISPFRTELSINNSKLSGVHFRKIFDRCNQYLITVDLSGSFQVDDDTVSYILEKCRNVRNLRIRNCRKLTAKSLQSILLTKTALLELDIGGDFNIDIKGIDNFLSNYPFIDSINNIQLSGLVLHDSTMSLLIRKCKGLAKVGIAYADISDQSLTRLIQSTGPQLTYLNIAWLSTTSSPSHVQIEGEKLIQAIIACCPVLEELDVCGIKSLTSTDIYSLIDSLNQKSLLDTGMRHPLRIVHAKFIQSTKAQLEMQLVSAFPYIKFDI